MTQAFWTPERATGGLLVASLLIGLAAAVIMVASGAMSGSSAMIRGSLAAAAPYAATLRLLLLMFGVAWIVQLLGLGLLARLLLSSGQEQLAVLAFPLALLAAVLAVLYTTFRMSVELWAAEEAARTGSIPEMFAPLQAWTNSFFRVAYLVHLLVGAEFGWGILRAGLLAPSLGWAAIIWSVLWLIGGLAGVGAPAVPLLMPAIIGIALLLR